MAYEQLTDEALRLRVARKRRGFDTAKKAAAFFGWSYDTYAQHENGQRGITRAAAKYAKAYKVSKAWLLTGEGAIDGGAVSEEVSAMHDLLKGIPEDRRAEAIRFLEFLSRDQGDKPEPDDAVPRPGTPKA